MNAGSHRDARPHKRRTFMGVMLGVGLLKASITMSATWATRSHLKPSWQDFVTALREMSLGFMRLVALGMQKNMSQASLLPYVGDLHSGEGLCENQPAMVDAQEFEHFSHRLLAEGVLYGCVEVDGHRFLCFWREADFNPQASLKDNLKSMRFGMFMSGPRDWFAMKEFIETALDPNFDPPVLNAWEDYMLRRHILKDAGRLDPPKHLTDEQKKKLTEYDALLILTSNVSEPTKS